MELPTFTDSQLLLWGQRAVVGLVLLTGIVSVVVHIYSSRVNRFKENEQQEYRQEFEHKITSARSQVTAAEGKVAAAESKAAAAERKAAAAEAKAEDAQAELEKIREPRTLSHDDKKKISTAMKAFQGQKFSLAVFQDPEAINFARTLHHMLVDAGWTRVSDTVGLSRIDVAGHPAAITVRSGLALLVTPEEEMVPRGWPKLAAHLEEAGFPSLTATYAPEVGFPPMVVFIEVGKKWVR